MSVEAKLQLCDHDWIQLDYYKSCSKCYKNTKLYCCETMTINEDTSATCKCGLIIFNAVQCATSDQYFANGGRKRTPYKRINYFRKWMRYILGYRDYVDKETLQKIKDNLKEPTPQSLKKTLKKLKIHNKSTSYILSEITGEKIPDVSVELMRRVEWMFIQLDGKIPYYPDVIYKLFYKIDPNHPLLGWIPRRALQYAN